MSDLRSELESIYREHAKGLYSLALSITCCTDLAEDAVHDAFVGMCRRKHRPTTRLTPYVFAVVRNAAIDLRRNNGRQQRLCESIFNGRVPLAAGPVSPPDDLLTAERDEALRHAIEELSSQDRETVILKVFSGLTFEEVGQVLSVSPKTIATRYRRALIKLEQRLDDPS